MGTNEFQKKIMKTKFTLDEAFSKNEPVAENNIATATLEEPQAIKAPPVSQPKFLESHKTHEGSTFKRRMTIHITEEAYEAFQTIYATRLLHKRDTEKGDLVCEAFALLYDKEKKEGFVS